MRMKKGKKKDHIGERLRAEREKRNLSQSELARRVKTPRTHIVAIEKGRRGIGVRLLNRISVVLGVQINVFGANAEDVSQTKVQKAGKKAPRARIL